VKRRETGMGFRRKKEKDSNSRKNHRFEMNKILN